MASRRFKWIFEGSSGSFTVVREAVEEFTPLPSRPPCCDVMPLGPREASPRELYEAANFACIIQYLCPNTFTALLNL